MRNLFDSNGFVFFQKKEEKEKKKDDEEPPVEDVQDILERQKMDNGLNEFRWGQNLLLLGDNLW